MVFAVLMSAVMALSMSLAFTLMNTGFNQDFLPIYAKATVISFMVGFPISRIVIRFVRLVVKSLFETA
jgi:uncharacterized membrane protein (DUF485 family)